MSHQDEENLLPKVFQFIKSHQSLINCHLSDFITENLWEKCLSAPLRKELDDFLCRENFDNIFSFLGDKKNIETQKFLSDIKLLNLESCYSEINDLKEFLVERRENVNSLLEKFELTKQKKCYEVTAFGDIISKLIDSENDIIVDAGAGKGYLSTYLSYNYNIRVIGIDSSEVCQNGATRRGKVLEQKTRLSFPLVRYVLENINDRTDYSEMVRTCFPGKVEKNGKIILVGLHTCGTLGLSMIRSFINSQEIQTLCVIPCCYHLTMELLSVNNETLSKNARQLAQQSIERFSNKELVDPLSPSLFYRAVLQQLLRSLGISSVKVGRKAPIGNFAEYAGWALRKIQIPEEKIPSIEYLESFYKSYLKEKRRMEVFQVLRIHLGSVVETAIILDRITYLKNSGKCSKVLAVKLFDPVLSPRCYALLAMK